MSWDVILVRTKTNEELVEEINETNTVVFKTKDVIAKLKEMFASVDHVDDHWLHYEGESYAISFNLTENNHIMMHISILDEPDDSVEVVIRDLCRLFECRAFDTTSGVFIG